MAKPKAVAEKPKGARPTYNARVRQNPDSDFMVTIGAAWPFNEGDGLVVNLNLIPTNWDGKFILEHPSVKLKRIRRDRGSFGIPESRSRR